jgi:5'-nucleotidase
MCLVSLAQSEKRITILHTNDMHSRLTGYAPESDYSPLTVNDDNTIGGFARIAAIISKEKDNNTGTTLVVDAGDFLMGTLFQSLEVNTGFQLRLMKSMGYDVTCIGNHEYDFGPDKLASIIRSSLKGGEIPGLLIGNALFDIKDDKDDGLEKLLDENILKRTIIITRDGIKTGFFSLLGENAVDVAPNAKPVTFEKQIRFAKKMIKELEEEKCDIIVCVSHSGLYRDEEGIYSGEDVDLAKKVKGLDLIISGHTHTRLDQPLIINGVPIVQTGEYGESVGRISLLLSGGNLKIENYSLIPVDDNIMGDKAINQLIEDQRERITTEILRPLGISYTAPVAETDFKLECNLAGAFWDSNLGPVIADAIHFYVNQNESNGTDVSMVAAGVIRDKIVPGIQTAPDIFRVMSLGSGSDNVPGYPLARLYVTGKELKSILEILQVAYKSSSDNYCYYSGIRVEYDPDRGLLRKISKIEIVHSDGSKVNVDFSKKSKTLYSITANSYMLEFIGIIKKMSFGLINVVPKDISGGVVTDMKTALIDFDENKDGVQEGKEWLALMEFLGSMKDSNQNGIPEIDSRYTVPVRSFYSVKQK